MAVRSPTVRRRELGARLRALRTERGLTVDHVADVLMCSPSKVSRMETGQRGATLRDVRDLCDLYGVTDEAERDRLMRLAREAKQTGWWQSHDLESFATYVGLEAEAAAIKYYQSTIVPGLMQTPDYARSIHEASIPGIAPERIDELIEVRLTRQQLLTQSPSVHVEAVFDEAVLHRVVGGPQVMKAQLDHFTKVASLPNVTIQVIPYIVGAHPAMDSTFNILDFAGSVPSVVYVEGLVGWIYVERPPEIDRYEQVFDHLRAIASSPEQSIDLIARVSANY
jgi:transcriptional regulator with XRE-family HTH domain